MKFSKTILYMIVCVCTLLVSCNNDDKEETLTSYKPDMFVNTWCTFDELGQSTVLTLYGTHKVILEENLLTEGATVSTSSNGTWSYYPSNNVIVLSISHQTSSSNISILTTSYKVKNLSEGKMTLINQETGSTETFYRLAEELTVSVGEPLENLLPSKATFVSSNTDIISLDTNGKPIATGYGFAYLMIEEDNTEYAVKIISLHPSQVMVGYLGESIEKILEIYGEPDATGSLTHSLAVLYNKNLSEGLSAIQVQYDPLSLEITRILVQYSSQSIWEGDKKFIASWLNQDDDMYFPGHSMLESPFLLSVFESQGKYYVSYNNENYYLEHGHYAPAHKIIGVK